LTSSIKVFKFVSMDLPWINFKDFLDFKFEFGGVWTFKGEAKGLKKGFLRQPTPMFYLEDSKQFIKDWIVQKKECEQCCR